MRNGPINNRFSFNSLQNMSQVWNDGATTFTAIKMDVTDTASNASSLLMDLQVGGTSMAHIDKNGIGRFTAGIEIYSGATDIGAILNSSGALGIFGTSTRDVVIGSDSAGTAIFVEGVNGRVGFGTTSPNSVTHIVGPSARPTALAEFDTASALQIQSDSGNTASLYVAEGNSKDQILQVTDGTTNSSTAGNLLLNPYGGNIMIGGVSAAASADAVLHLFNGTAPTGSVTDGVVLYSEDVSSSAELKVRDEAGNITTLSPHNFSGIAAGASEDGAWSHYSEFSAADGTRKTINVDMLALARAVESMTGENLVHIQ